MAWKALQVQIFSLMPVCCQSAICLNFMSVFHKPDNNNHWRGRRWRCLIYRTEQNFFFPLHIFRCTVQQNYIFAYHKLFKRWGQSAGMAIVAIACVCESLQSGFIHLSQSISLLNHETHHQFMKFLMQHIEKSYLNMITTFIIESTNQIDHIISTVKQAGGSIMRWGTCYR